MSKKIYLIGGNAKSFLKEVDSLEKFKDKKIYVLDLTSDNKEEVVYYRNFWKEYLEKLGAGKIDFASVSSSSDAIKEKLLEADILYIPGGQTELLIENVKKYNLASLIREFNGPIIGNSAGAAVLSEVAIMYPSQYREKITILEGMGLVDLEIFVHYDKIYDEELLKLSKNKKIYGIPEESIVIYNDEKLNFIGDVYLFSKGNKTKVN